MIPTSEPGRAGRRKGEVGSRRNRPVRLADRWPTIDRPSVRNHTTERLLCHGESPSNGGAERGDTVFSAKVGGIGRWNLDYSVVLIHFRALQLRCANWAFSGEVLPPLL